MNQRILDCLIDLARNVSPVGGTKIAAALVVKNRIISLGHNRRKSHPLQKRYAKNCEAIYLHAEIDCLRHVIDDDLSSSILYLARVYRNGIPAFVEPCLGCIKALDAFGIKKVYHT